MSHLSPSQNGDTVTSGLKNTRTNPPA